MVRLKLYRGMSLVEVMIAMLITSTILLATQQVMTASRRAITVAALEADLSAQATVVCDRLANELKEAISGTISGPVGFNTKENITFQKCMGFDAAGMIKGNPITFAPYYGGTRTNPYSTTPIDLYLVRRTEVDPVAGTLTEDLTDELYVVPGSPPMYGMLFNLEPGTTDIWNIQVQLFRGNFIVARSTKVQVKQ